MTHTTKQLESLGNSIAYRVRQYDLHHWPLSSVNGHGNHISIIDIIQLRAIIVAHGCYVGRKDRAICAKEVGTHVY